MNGSLMRGIFFACLLPGFLFVSGCAYTGKLISNYKSPREKAMAKMDIARVLEKQGNLRRAEKLYLELYRKNPRDVRACNRLAVVASIQGDQEKAEHFFLEGLEIDPDDTQHLTDYGYHLYLSNEFEAAEFHLKHAASIRPEDSRIITNLALAQGYQGKFDESFETFRQVVTQAEAHNNLGYIHSQMGNGAKAMEHYSRALSLDDTLKSAANSLAQIAELQMKHGVPRRLEAEPQKEYFVDRNNERTEANSSSGSGIQQASFETENARSPAQTQFREDPIPSDFPDTKPQSRNWDNIPFGNR